MAHLCKRSDKVKREILNLLTDKKAVEIASAAFKDYFSNTSAESGDILGFHQERQNGISEHEANSGNYFLCG